MDTPSIDGAPSVPSQSVQPKLLGKCGSQPPRDYYVVRESDSVVRDQILITGPKKEVIELADRLFGAPTDALARRALVEEISLDIRAQYRADVPSAAPVQEPAGHPRFASAAPSTLITRVYPLPENMDLETTLETAYVLSEGLDQPVFAEPSYLLGGSSGCIEGGPVGFGGPAAGEAKFWQQWAFGPKGIKRSGRVKKPNEDTDVCVAVFDTSPFALPGKWHIPWLRRSPRPLKICVWHPEPGLDPSPETRDSMSGRYLDHGLFVSSMVHAVAPESNIHLIRVLNEHNLGDVPTLTKALLKFLQWDLARRGGNLRGTVLNLSLGLVEEPDPNDKLLSRVRQLLDARTTRPNMTRFDSLADFPLAGLEAVLHAAEQAGAIVVACAGNGSKSYDIQPADAPACYDCVIGVAGHGEHLGRSSFSNRDEIAAPAGDIPLAEEVPGARGGKSKLDNIKPDGKREKQRPDDWLIGLSMYCGEEQGYMYWRGTSFAAPLVAGGAAHHLLVGVPPADVRDQIMSEAANNPASAPIKKRFKVKKPVGPSSPEPQA